MKAWITEQLNQKLSPSALVVTDNSHHHIGHPGNTGGGHFHVFICSRLFRGHSKLERHRMVYRALNGKVGKQIHACEIEAIADDEYNVTHTALGTDE